MSKLEKILSFILLSLMLMSCFSCVTKKKLIESQQSESTRVLDITEIRISKSSEALKQDILETLNKKTSEHSKEENKSDKTEENESVKVSGTLEPKEKETSVTVGNTTIKNDGGNVSFEINTTKQYKAELESFTKVLHRSIEEQRNALMSTEKLSESQINELKKEKEQLRSQIETISKQVNKKGLSIWIWIALGLIAVYFIYRFKHKIPFI